MNPVRSQQGLTNAGERVDLQAVAAAPVGSTLWTSFLLSAHVIAFAYPPFSRPHRTVPAVACRAPANRARVANSVRLTQGRRLDPAGGADRNDYQSAQGRQCCRSCRSPSVTPWFAGGKIGALIFARSAAKELMRPRTLRPQ